MRTFIGAKLHGLRVTGLALYYHGSVAIDRLLLHEAGISPYERVTVVNLATGERWDTYALPHDDPGAFILQGGSARLGEVGDPCVVMTWVTADEFVRALVVMLNEANRVVDVITYR